MQVEGAAPVAGTSRGIGVVHGDLDSLLPEDAGAKQAAGTGTDDADEPF